MENKFNKNRPDMIKLHKKAPQLAKRIVVIDKSWVKYTDEYFAIKNKRDLIKLEKNIVFDEIRKKFSEELNIISPNGNLKYRRIDNEVYILKGKENKCECIICKNSSGHTLKDFIEKMR